MTIPVNCTECKKHLKVGEKYAGRNVKCPSCGAVITIPSAEAFASSSTIHASSPKKPITDSRMRIHCSNCKRTLTVLSKHAGKRVKCPSCESAVEVPQANKSGNSQQMMPEARASSSRSKGSDSSHLGNWYCRDHHGEVYGPVTKPTLDTWVTEGRVLPDWEIRHDNWAEWKLACNVFTELTPKRPQPYPSKTAGSVPNIPELIQPTASHVSVNVAGQRTDAPGVIGVVFGVISWVLILFGFFTCGITWFLVPFVAGLGTISSILGHGNYRVLGLVLNLLILGPIMIMFALSSIGIMSIPLLAK